MPPKQRKNNNKKPGPSGASSTSIGSTIKQMLPGMLKALLPVLIGSIPFPTSGARAIASPMNPFSTSVSAPSANGAVVKTTKADLKNTRTGICVKHREYLMDVVHTDPDVFELLAFQSINPTNQILFPWLASIATRFETYKFKTLRFIYEPQCSTGSVGTVMMVVDYDASDQAPNDKTQMMAYKGAVRSPAWFACVNSSAITDLRKQKNYYVATSQQGGTEDPRFSNVGNFILAFQSESDAYTAGELYVEYDIELETPVLDKTTASYVETFNAIVDSEASDWDTFTPIATLGTLGVVENFTDNDLYFTFPSTGTFQFIIYGSATPTASSTQNLLWSLVSLSANSSVNFFSSFGTVWTASDQGQTFVEVWGVNINDPDTILQLSPVVTGSGLENISLTNTRFIITPIQSGTLITDTVATSSEARFRRELRLVNSRLERRRSRHLTSPSEEEFIKRRQAKELRLRNEARRKLLTTSENLSTFSFEEIDPDPLKEH
jgi:hypothetical protein